MYGQIDEDLWLAWDGERRLTIGGIGKTASSELFVVLGHTPPKSGQHEVNSKLIGAYETIKSNRFCLSIKMDREFEYIEVLRLEEKAAFPIKAFRLVNDQNFDGKTDAVGYVLVGLIHDYATNTDRFIPGFHRRESEIKIPDIPGLAWMSRSRILEIGSQSDSRKLESIAPSIVIPPSNFAPIRVSVPRSLNPRQKDIECFAEVPAVFGTNYASRHFYVPFGVRLEGQGCSLEGLSLIHVRRQAKIAELWNNKANASNHSPLLKSSHKDQISRSVIDWLTKCTKFNTAQEAESFGKWLQQVFNGEHIFIGIEEGLDSPLIRVIRDSSQSDLYDVQVGMVSIGDHFIFMDMHDRFIQVDDQCYAGFIAFELKPDLSLNQLHNTYSRDSDELSEAFFQRTITLQKQAESITEISPSLREKLKEISDPFEEDGFSALFGITALALDTARFEQNEWNIFKEDPAAYQLSHILFGATAWRIDEDNIHSSGSFVDRVLGTIGAKIGLEEGEDIRTELKLLSLLWQSKNKPSVARVLQICDDLSLDNNLSGWNKIVEAAHELDKIQTHRNNHQITQVIMDDQNAEKLKSVLGISTETHVQLEDVFTYVEKITKINAFLSQRLSHTQPDETGTTDDISAVKQKAEQMVEKLKEMKATEAAQLCSDCIESYPDNRSMLLMMMNKIREEFPEIGSLDLKTIKEGIAPHVSSDSNEIDRLLQLSQEFINHVTPPTHEIATQSDDTLKSLLQASSDPVTSLNSDESQKAINVAHILHSSEKFNELADIVASLREDDISISPRLMRLVSIWPRDANKTIKEIEAFRNSNSA
ncbi:hypothetical protein [Cohaesibacter gelatinilyticus]|uniref:Uncharacterized protein n=1 Tax=Cohaesibacter gelatinilyticus TaxID=372072 RepID=A0A285PFP7_9HYPH|nr:hypothetical protein [Cohaesibacter gelatinilyticus]SNZ20113.1 hypothetical protein SAMN06265368_3214 [Cohaesibacter gelatinilyticus]